MSVLVHVCVCVCVSVCDKRMCKRLSATNVVLVFVRVSMVIIIAISSPVTQREDQWQRGGSYDVCAVVCVRVGVGLTRGRRE